MKTFNHYSDHELVTAIKLRVAQERAATCDILDFLFEVQSRMLFAAIGFSSLHDFCVRELGYSDGAAYRRIAAMKLSRELPAAKATLADGKLSLTTASTLQSFFEREKKERAKSYSLEEKSDLVAELQGKSKTECERKLTGISPQAFPREKARVISDTGETEIRFVASASLIKKIDRLRKLTAYRTSGSSHAALMECLVDLGLKTWDPLERPFSKGLGRKVAGTVELGKVDLEEVDLNVNSVCSAKSLEAASPEKLRAASTPDLLLNQASPAKLGVPHFSRYISRQVRTYVWRRDFGRCTFIDSISGRACSSCYGLQIDHIIPFAKGGSSEPGNLRLLCRAHNVLSARRSFGTAKTRGAGS